MRDRLIDLLDNATVEKTEQYPDGTPALMYCKKAVNRSTAIQLANYIIEDGWIRPPVKLNQILYKPDTFRNMIDECRVSSITQKADGTFKIRLTNLYYRAVFEVTEKDLGKIVFLTREEANQTLKDGGE